MKLKSVGLGIFSALTFLFMIGTVSARSIDVTIEDITNQNNTAFEYDSTLGYRLPTELETSIRDAADGDVINLSPGDYSNLMLELNGSVTVNFEAGTYTNLFIRVKNNVTFQMNGDVVFTKDDSKSNINYAAIWISGNKDDTINGTLTIQGDNFTIQGYSMGIAAQRFDAGSSNYANSLIIENKNFTVTNLRADGKTWISSWMQPIDTLSTWQHGVALFFSGMNNSIPSLTIKNGAHVYLMGNGTLTSTGNTTASGIYFSESGKMDLIENSKLIVSGTSGNAIHVQDDYAASRSDFKVNIVDSMFGINHTGGLGMNNLNNGDRNVQNMIIDNSKVIVTNGKNAGVQYGTYEIMNQSVVIIGEVPEEYSVLYQDMFESKLTSDNVGNDRDGFYVHNLTVSDSTLIANGNNCSGIYITTGYAMITNSTVIANENGTTQRFSGWKPSRRMGIFLGNGALVENSTIITNDNCKDLSLGTNVASLSGLVASGEVTFRNSVVTSTDPYAWNLYNTSSSGAVIVIDENTVSIAEGSYNLSSPVGADEGEDGNNDIVDDYNSQGNTGTVIVNGGSMQASSEATVDNVTKPYDDVFTRVDIVNDEDEDLYRFDLHDSVNVEVGALSNQAGEEYRTFTYYHKNGIAHLYSFRFNLLGEDLDPNSYGNAYVWAPYTIIHYDATEGMIVLDGSTAVAGDTNRFASDITIFGNSLNLTEKVMPIAVREGYVFEGWFIAVNNGEVEIDLAKALADANYFEELYSILNMEYDGSTKALTIIDDLASGAEEITLYAKWSKIGDVVAHYVDEDGNPLADDIILSGAVGSEYTTEALEIEGYTLKNVIGNTTGTYIDGVIEVTYIYEFTSGIGGGEPIEPVEPSIPNVPEEILPPQTGIMDILSSKMYGNSTNDEYTKASTLTTLFGSISLLGLIRLRRN